MLLAVQLQGLLTSLISSCALEQFCPFLAVWHSGLGKTLTVEAH